MWKLVRDRIPEIIHSQGNKTSAFNIKDKALLLALQHKLVEEAQEVAELSKEYTIDFKEQLLEELCDVAQVMHDIAIIINVDAEDIKAKVESKLQVRGGFENGCMLKIE